MGLACAPPIHLIYTFRLVGRDNGVFIREILCTQCSIVTVCIVAGRRKVTQFEEFVGELDVNESTVFLTLGGDPVPGFENV